MTTVIDHVEGHYETQRMSYGKAYVWCPECVVVECDCGSSLGMRQQDKARLLPRGKSTCSGAAGLDLGGSRSALRT